LKKFFHDSRVDSFLSLFSSPTNWAGFPTVAGQRRNLHAVNDSALEGWIEIAHRLFIEVDDAARFERPDIVYLNDGALLGDFNKGVGGPIVFAVADATVCMPPSSYPGWKGSYIDAVPTIVTPMAHALWRLAVVDLPTVPALAIAEDE
jgi:hypothetical protein